MTDQCDLGGNSILRLTRFYVVSRVLPMGNNRGGPGWKCLLTLIILHYFGVPLYWLEGRFQRQFNLLRRIKRRLGNR